MKSFQWKSRLSPEIHWHFWKWFSISRITQYYWILCPSPKISFQLLLTYITIVLKYIIYKKVRTFCPKGRRLVKYTRGRFCFFTLISDLFWFINLLLKLNRTAGSIQHFLQSASSLMLNFQGKSLTRVSEEQHTFLFFSSYISSDCFHSCMI